jgi:hypothetical protein
VTFADGVLKLVRAGARIEVRNEPAVRAEDDDLAEALRFASEALPLDQDGSVWHAAGTKLAATEPGLADLEAAVAMVEAGVASRIVLAGFPSWPGLLWRAYELADATKVVILPTVVRPGGLVDIVITRDFGADV